MRKNSERLPSSWQGAGGSHSQAGIPGHGSRFKIAKQELESQVGGLELRSQALLGCLEIRAARGWPPSLRTASWGSAVPELCSLSRGSWPQAWEEQAGEGHIQGGR